LTRQSARKIYLDDMRVISLPLYFISAIHFIFTIYLRVISPSPFTMILYFYSPAIKCITDNIAATHHDYAASAPQWADARALSFDFVIAANDFRYAIRW